MKKLTTYLIIMIILVFSLLIIFNHKEVYSENENRYLATYPVFSLDNFISGKYSININEYLSDHFVFRDKLVSLKTSVLKIFGQKEINEVYLGDNNYLMMEYNKPVNSDKIIDSLNNFYKNFNYLNVELMLVPTSISINSESLPKYVSESQVEDIDYIYSKIRFNTIDVYKTLLEHNNTYQMYYYLDHHWTSYGAYYAYLEYCRSNNLTSIPIYNFNIEKVSDNFKGSLYSKVLDNSLDPDTIYIFNYDNNYTVNYNDIETDTIYNMEALEKKDKYEVFLGGNYPLVTITNNKVKDKELLIIKDSYANSMIPFLINHFNKIHIIDPRYYNDSISNYVKDNKITDILFLYNIGTIDSDTGIRSIK